MDAFNLEYRTPGHVLTGCWLTALFTLGQELSFLRIPDVTLKGLSATVGASLYSAFYSDVHAFGQSGPPTSPLTPGPAIRPLAGLQQAIQGAHSATTITFPEALTIGSQHEPTLVATITDRPTDRPTSPPGLGSGQSVIDSANH